MAKVRTEKETFWEKFWHESETLRMHICIVLLLLFAMLVVGGTAKVLELWLPESAEDFKWIERVDIRASFALVCLFAAYTVSVVAIRLYKSVRRELNEK